MLTGLLLHKLTYVGMFFFLAGAGIYAPIPEELTLLVAGYFVALGIMAPSEAAIIAAGALLVGDSILFFLAKTGSGYAKRLHMHLSERGFERTWIFSPAHPLRAVFLLRFVTGLRMISPIFAGFNGASWAGFLAVDIAAILIFVPVMLMLGFHFSANFIPFITMFEFFRHLVFWSIVALLGGSILFVLSPRLYRFFQKFRKEKIATRHAERE